MFGESLLVSAVRHVSRNMWHTILMTTEGKADGLVRAIVWRRLKS